MSRPNFICIGVQKAATTWLHGVIGLHPDIFTSEEKEVDFFTHNFNRGYVWYESHFAGSEGKTARGETSPSYLYDPAAPLRAHAYEPGLRLIAILRDPVARAFSNHLHELGKRHIPEDFSFEDAEPRNPLYVEQGLYAAHLRRWIELFGRDALLVLLNEEIAADPGTALDQVYAHLGVAPGFRPPRFDERRHESAVPKLRGLQQALKFGGDGLRSAGLGEALERLKRFGPLKAVLAANRRDLRQETPEMRAETRARLEARFADDVMELTDLLGRSSLPWPTWRAAAARAASGAA